LRGIGSHLCGSNQKIKEILEGMAEAILYEDWLRFDDLNFNLKMFKPSRRCLDTFGRGQMKDLIIRNPSILEIETLRRKLGEIGISDEALDLGYEDAQKIIQ
jgi:hypothetical protein